MKHIFLFLVLLLVVAGCNHPTKNAKTTQNDVKKAEAALFNEEDMTANTEAIPDAIEVFSKYAEENPEAEDAPEYLFKAFEVSVNTRQDPKQSIGFVDRLLAQYPKFDKNPVALFMLATFVYDDQLHDLDKARECYQRVMNEYPESPFARDAAISIEQLGLSPEELIRRFEEASAE